MGYKIGFWNYRRLHQQNDGTVDEWDELGLNYAMTPFLRQEEKDDFFRMLRQAEAKGIQLVVKDFRTQWTKLKEVGEEKFREGVREAYEQLKEFKCIHSFFIGDEPNNDDIRLAASAARIVQEECRGISAFLSMATPVTESYEFYKNKIIGLVREAGLKYIVYNCYCQLENREDQRQQGVDQFIRYLNLYREVREATGVEVWISILSMGHYCFRAPTADDIRWQLNVAAMFGVTGFIWYAVYYYYNRIWAGGPRNFAVNHLGDHTETFMYMREENWFFRKYVAPFIDGCTLEEVYFEWKFWLPVGGTRQFMDGEDEVVDTVRDNHNCPLLISRFKTAGGEPVVMICNASQRECAAVDITFKAPYERFGKRVYLAPGAVYPFDFK